MTTEEKKESRNFIQQMIDADLVAGKGVAGKGAAGKGAAGKGAAGSGTAEKGAGLVHTRFPPEPNGYLHIGHAKSICLNAGLAREYDGKFNLRFDDTNPAKEEQEYVDSIMDDVRWLGAEWEDRLYFASDYFEQLYAWAVQLVQAGMAYVCDLDAEAMRENRGSLTEPGKNSPYRERSLDENLDLLARMRAGEFADGSRTLRAKIDMASPNLNLRDPVMYRIKRAHHHRTADRWCIYPSYDFTHGQSDSLEGITHSICTLEFENHRPLYDWYLDQIGSLNPGLIHPRQIEFARLNITYAVMSKRKLKQLVDEGHVTGWDDPRMLTIRGLRRRGYTSVSIRAFCDRIGVAKAESTIDMAWLEDAVREDLNEHAPRRMGVLRPLKVVIENFPENQVEQLEAANHPQQPEMGSRQVPFSRELYIEQADFMEDAPKKFFRLSVGREVRLRYAYFITCTEVVKDAAGNVVELRCTYDPATKGGNAPDGRKVKGTIHWVSAAHALNAEVRLYDHLFSVENPDVPAAAEGTFLDNLNPTSLEVLSEAQVEPDLTEASSGTHFQFERNGYFFVDPIDSQPGKPIFSRTTTLRDTWAKVKGKSGKRKAESGK